MFFKVSEVEKALSSAQSLERSYRSDVLTHVNPDLKAFAAKQAQLYASKVCELKSILNQLNATRKVG